MRALLVATLVLGCARVPPPEPAPPAAPLPSSAAAPEPTPLPAPLPSSAAAPEPTPLPAPPRPSDADIGAPAPDDPLELLYARRLSFEGGEPLVTLRVAEGLQEIVLAPRGAMHVAPRRGAAVDAPAGGEWRIRLISGTPGTFVASALVEEVRFADHVGAAQRRDEWAARGYDARLVSVGQVYGIAGRVVDTRRTLVVLAGDGTEAKARALAADAAQRFGVKADVHRELVTRPSGRLSLVAPSGAPVLESDDALTLTSEGDAGVTVRHVEFGVGYAFHNFEDRTYSGKLLAVVDAHGTLALVDALPLERLAAGIVPSEIFPRAPAEALKAQAVTARGEILAKIGARHLGDPYLLCAEQHCQVYKGLAAQERSTDAAVVATAGEALFTKAGHLVDSVYSAVCGGHTEDNDVVWGGPPDPSLRGRPDDAHGLSFAGPDRTMTDGALRRFLATNDGYCSGTPFAKPDKYRWERKFTASEVDSLAEHLGVGHVKAMIVAGRGVSGRARALKIEGDAGVATVGPELAIRRLFKNLNSGMFLVERDAAGWTFRGGGWGHGVGMCQVGAIGRAERGEDYRAILRWYFSGAEPAKIY